MMLNVSLALPLSHNGLLLNLPVLKMAIFIYAQRHGRTFSCPTTTSGGLPKLNNNYRSTETIPYTEHTCLVIRNT